MLPCRTGAVYISLSHSAGVLLILGLSNVQGEAAVTWGHAMCAVNTGKQPLQLGFYCVFSKMVTYPSVFVLIGVFKKRKKKRNLVCRGSLNRSPRLREVLDLACG